MRTPESAVAHEMNLEMARREFALEMAMEHEIACIEAGYSDSVAEEIVDAAEVFYDFLCGDEDLPVIAFAYSGDLSSELMKCIEGVSWT